EEDELDLARFERLRERARGLDAAEAAETLRRALQLWRGAPLADFAFEPWAQGEIARLEELRVVCMEERIEAGLALGRHADLVDSTALAEALDAEVVRRLIGRYFEAVARALERHGATLEKFIGDAVMAVFGIPAVHEDDALRAVRAAVEAGAALAALNSELE